jgi:hypothetical protein
LPGSALRLRRGGGKGLGPAVARVPPGRSREESGPSDRTHAYIRLLIIRVKRWIPFVS